MRLVEPKVFLVGETKSNPLGIQGYLTEIGVPDWTCDSPTDAEGLLEVYGRGCYRSFKPGLNPNVSKVREGNAQYLANIKQQRHGSVFEHVSANFIFLYVSRVFTHELVRHRVGTGISQESLRFVRLDNLDFWMPPDIADNPEAKAIFEEAITKGEEWQMQLASVLGLDDPSAGFSYKKRMTSAMRRIAPEGLATMVGWTANFRTLRHVIEQRTDPAAEDEIRLVFGKVAEIAIQRWPNAFGDYEVGYFRDLPRYSTFNSKI